MKILVAIDSSGYADEILNEITRRDWVKDAEFNLLTTIEPYPNWNTEQDFLHQSRVILDHRINILRKRLPQNNIFGQVLQGSATSLITKTAQEWGAHLIIIGSHGDTGKRKAEIDSVAAAVVNEAPCSVEVVKLRRGSRQDHSVSAGASHHL